MCLMQILCVYVCVCLCECVCQESNRQSDGAGAGAELILFRGGGQSELTQERTAGQPCVSTPIAKILGSPLQVTRILGPKPTDPHTAPKIPQKRLRIDFAGSKLGYAVRAGPSTRGKRRRGDARGGYTHIKGWSDTSRSTYFGLNT